MAHIRNDIQKREEAPYTVKSIQLVKSSVIANHSAALVTKTNGSTLLYMWGDNTYGQLGNGSSGGFTSVPTLVNASLFGSSPITEVAIGLNHSAVLVTQKDGSTLMYAWGVNTQGELGVGHLVNQSTPTKVNNTLFGNNKIIQIALGGQHSGALLADGSLYMWGLSKYGEIGVQNAARARNPTRVTDVLGSKKVTEITLGLYTTAAVVNDNTLYVWGSNNHGQLGFTPDWLKHNLPREISSTHFKGKTFKQIKSGNFHLGAVLNDDSFYMWGHNVFGQLGIESKGGDIITPSEVDTSSFKSVIKEIALGEASSAALLEDGSLYMWGANQYGQLGFTANSNPNNIPKKIASTNFKSKITQIALGRIHSAALLEDGSLYMWGNNDKRQLGFSAATSTPTWMPQLGKTSAITANTAITAKEAVDNLWVDNKFNLTGFKNSFNLINIPDGGGQQITMISKPSFDDILGEITMTVEIKYFYSNTGLIFDTSTTAMTISGFASEMISDIAAKTTDVNPIVVDKWMNYVKVDGQFILTRLEEFLTFTEIPTDAEFIILDANYNANNKSGVLTFDILPSKVTHRDMHVFDTPVGLEPFHISLNLTPRITRMIPIMTNYPNDLTTAELKSRLFNEDGLVIDLDTLHNYMKVIAPVDDVTYHLVEDSWVPEPSTGTLQFKIYVSQYYDQESDLQTGSQTNPASEVNFDLQLQREMIVEPEKQIPEVFPWWWIVVGLGGLILLYIIALIIQRGKDLRHFPYVF